MIKKTLWILVIKAAILGVIFTILGNVGGKSDTLRQSVEEFIAETTGAMVEIRNFKNLRIFPRIIIDFEDLYLYNAKVQDVGGIRKLYIEFGFWDVILGNGRFHAIEMTGARLPTGPFLPRPVEIQSIQLDDDQSLHIQAL